MKFVEKRERKNSRIRNLLLRRLSRDTWVTAYYKDNFFTHNRISDIFTSGNSCGRPWCATLMRKGRQLSRGPALHNVCAAPPPVRLVSLDRLRLGRLGMRALRINIVSFESPRPVNTSACLVDQCAEGAM